MPSLFPRRRKTYITAAAGDVGTGGSPTPADVIGKRMERWQERVLQLISAVPESAGASALIHNTMNQIELRVEAEGVQEAHIADLNRFIANFDLGRAGMLIWQVGEIYVVYRQDGDTFEWDVNSPLEVSIETGKAPKVLGINDKFNDIPPSSKYFRIWKPDPAKKYKAWSPHKGVMDLLEAMHMHQLADTAVATSRLAGAGILFWPTNMPSIDPQGGPPVEGSQEKLQEELQKAMMQSITDRNSADAVVPLVVFGDPTVGENFKPEHILLERPDDAKAFSTRMEKYSERYARGVELPIEAIQGLGPANHWTAWVVKEDKWRFYLAPLAELIANALLKNFIKTSLRRLGYSEQVIRDAKVIADGTTLIEKPDKSDAALRLKQMNVMSDEAALRETGFNPETDKASPEEQARGQVRLQEMPANFRDSSPT